VRLFWATDNRKVTTMSQKQYQRYNQDFKDKALALLGLGKPVQEVAQELQVSSSMLYAWRNQAKSSQLGSAGLRAVGEQSEADELRALRRQVTRLQAENDILKKAAVLLGTMTPNNNAR
jgi:transposase